MKIYEVKLKNKNQKTMLIDEQSYRYFTEDPVLKEMKVMENLREHSTSGGAVYQKWFRDIQNNPYLETIYIHKAIAEKFIPRTDENRTYVIHLNGNRLDNRIENLKWCTASDRNLYSRNEYQTGYKGVRKELDKYRAIMYSDKRKVDLGLYDTAEEASKAYIEASSLLKKERKARKVEALLESKSKTAKPKTKNKK
ncbi:MAG: HNH endonuclease [Bacteroidia bacterium]|nr:HNH endonuclease [Bacteroidia bacterium]